MCELRDSSTVSQIYKISLYLLLLEEVFEKTWPPATLAIYQRLLTPPLPLKCTFCPLFPLWEPFLRMQTWGSMCLGDHLDWIHDWTLLRPLYKLLRFWRQVPRATHLENNAQDKPRLVCTFPCLLTLPPTSLECSASFLGLSLPFVFRASFWTNINTHTNNPALECIY